MISEISNSDGYPDKFGSHILLFITKLAFLAICLGCLTPAWADSMRCGTRLVSDGKMPGATMSEVLDKCGEPYATHRNKWLYYKGDSVYRVYFNTNGEVRRIQREITR